MFFQFEARIKKFKVKSCHYDIEKVQKIERGNVAQSICGPSITVENLRIMVSKSADDLSHSLK
jgi:hypothetical protein